MCVSIIRHSTYMRTHSHHHGIRWPYGGGGGGGGLVSHYSTLANTVKFSFRLMSNYTNVYIESEWARAILWVLCYAARHSERDRASYPHWSYTYLDAEVVACVWCGMRDVGGGIVPLSFCLIRNCVFRGELGNGFSSARRVMSANWLREILESVPRLSNVCSIEQFNWIPTRPWILATLGDIIYSFYAIDARQHLAVLFLEQFLVAYPINNVSVEFQWTI